MNNNEIPSHCFFNHFGDGAKENTLSYRASQLQKKKKKKVIPCAQCPPLLHAVKWSSVGDCMC